MGFLELLNKVCGELPEGYQIVIICENGYAGVHLLDAEGKETDVPEECINEEDSLQGEILELLRMAKL